jgi:exopolysaccharide production protein ExoZ
MTEYPRGAAFVGTRPVGPGASLLSLQYLRAVAAFMVIYFHAVLQVRLFVGAHTVFPLIGAGGVDIFFVLSGFMMWYTVDLKPTTISAFLWRRITRIAPLYWSVTCVALSIAYFAPTLLRSTIFDPAHALASLLFVPWENPGSVLVHERQIFVPVIVPGWTVNLEMMFYLLFSLTLIVPKKIRVLSLALLLLGLFLLSGTVGRNSAFSFYHDTILFEFLTGATLGAAGLLRRPMRGRTALMLVMGGFTALLGTEILGADEVLAFRILIFGIPATLILIATLRAEASGSVPRVPLLNALGDASFSIYLTHGFVLAGLRFLTAKLGLAGSTPLFQASFILASLLAAAVAGLAVYRFVERPMMRAAGRWRRSPTRLRQPLTA